MGLIKPRMTKVPPVFPTLAQHNKMVGREQTRPADDYAAMRLRVQFDRNKLDDAVEQHSQDFLEICERETEAQSYLDEAKDGLARKDSELGRAFRVQQDKSGTKCTDKIVEDHVRTHPEHVRLTKEMAPLRADVDNWKNLRASFEHRKRMLQEMVALYLSGYYSDNAGTRNSLRDSGAAAGRQAMADVRRNRGSS